MDRISYPEGDRMLLQHQSINDRLVEEPVDFIYTQYMQVASQF